MKTRLWAIEKQSEYYGLRLNKDKCNLIAMNMNSKLKYKDNTAVPQTENIAYLGTTLTKADVDIKQEIATIINKAHQTWQKLKNLWNKTK